VYSSTPPDYELNKPSRKTGSKSESIELGTSIRLVPDALPDGKTVDLDFELEHRRLPGFKKHRGPDKKPQKVPQVAVDSIKTSCPIPEGKTLLIAGMKITERSEAGSSAPRRVRLPDGGTLLLGGQKITEQKKNKPRKARLVDLPLIGWLFSSSAKRTIEDTTNLLILIKPVINPPKKARAPLKFEKSPPFDPDDSLIYKLEEKLKD
jgi:type II secretory pathway component GspD/PulD (secretin)